MHSGRIFSIRELCRDTIDLNLFFWDEQFEISSTILLPPMWKVWWKCGFDRGENGWITYFYLCGITMVDEYCLHICLDARWRRIRLIFDEPIQTFLSMSIQIIHFWRCLAYLMVMAPGRPWLIGFFSGYSWNLKGDAVWSGIPRNFPMMIMLEKPWLGTGHAIREADPFLLFKYAE
jgi:hypothetical protein